MMVGVIQFDCSVLLSRLFVFMVTLHHLRLLKHNIPSSSSSSPTLYYHRMNQYLFSLLILLSLTHCLSVYASLAFLCFVYASLPFSCFVYASFLFYVLLLISDLLSLLSVCGVLIIIFTVPHFIHTYHTPVPVLSCIQLYSSSSH